MQTAKHLLFHAATLTSVFLCVVPIGCLSGAARADDFTSDQRQALRAINYYRVMAGLPKARLDPFLCRAAQNHADYRMANFQVRENAHSESPNLPGFTGRTAGERMQAAGYQGRTFGECMSFSERTGPESVDVLMQVPYHRIQFIQGEKLDIGIGKAVDPGPGWPRNATTWVYNFAGSIKPLSVWPPENARDVPPEGSVAESPDPMAIHGVKISSVGYVVTASFNEPNHRLIEARLETLNGQAVPIYVNHPGNDRNSPMRLLLIPAQPLQAFTTYTTRIKLLSQRGETIEKEWQFVTGSLLLHFEYRGACTRFPVLLKGGKRYRGIVATLANDLKTITLREISEFPRTPVSKARNKNKTARKPALPLPSRTYVLTPKSRMRHAVDPLGVDMEQVYASEGAEVIFTTDPALPTTLHDLLIVKSVAERSRR